MHALVSPVETEAHIGAIVDFSAVARSRTRHGNLARGVSEGELPGDNAITNGFPGRIVGPSARRPRLTTDTATRRSYGPTLYGNC